jgi:hypothetical protein
VTSVTSTVTRCRCCSGPAFEDPIAGDVDAWVPYNLAGDTDPENNSLSAVGRLKSGISLAQAREELSALSRSMRERWPAARLNAVDAVLLQEDLVTDVARLRHQPFRPSNRHGRGRGPRDDGPARCLAACPARRARRAENRDAGASLAGNRARLLPRRVAEHIAVDDRRRADATGSRDGRTRGGSTLASRADRRPSGPAPA